MTSSHKNIVARTIDLLPKEERRNALMMIFLLVMNSLLDFISLASFLPLILMVIDPQWVESSYLLHQFGLNSAIHAGIALTLAVMGIITLKTAFAQWVTYRKASFAYSVAICLAITAIDKHLKLKYIDFAKSDFARELNRLCNVPLTFANNILIPTGTLISEAMVVFLLGGVIAWLQFNALLLLALILIPSYFFYKHRRKKASEISANVGRVYPGLLKHTLALVEGLIDIRSYQKEQFFRKRFHDLFKEMASTFSDDHTSQTETARTTEWIAAFSVCAMILYSLLTMQTRNETLLLLSVYAGISFRIVPSINRIFSALHQIKINEHVLSELSDLHEPGEVVLNRSTVSPPDFTSAIQIENITFAYPGCDSILQSASLTIKKGEKIAITGVSGKGKTTLLHLVLGFLDRQSGDILLDGRKDYEFQPGAWQKLFAYVGQQPHMLDATIAENIAFGVPHEEINKGKVSELLLKMELDKWVDSLPTGIETLVGEKGIKISGGQRQRLAIARGLYHDRQILLLDEVTNHLDPQTESEIFQTLMRAGQNKTILMITHHPQLLKQFDHIYEVADGKIKKVSEWSSSLAS